MSGKIVGLVILLSAALGGGLLYYLQIYGFYEEVAAADVSVTLLNEEGAPEVIEVSDLRAIDAGSSPIRFRACFSTALRPGALAGYRTAPDVIPRNAPGWFDCFDAEAIANQLASGTAVAFVGQKNIQYGVDRIVAISQSGQGFVWHELNDCGEKAYDGTVVGEDCPPRPSSDP